MSASRRPREIPVEEYIAAFDAGDRAFLGRAITLVESNQPDDQRSAQQLLVALAPRAGAAYRVGITGVPGVGKSTLIERLGRNLTAAGNRVAVLAVDPSSSISGGSILGDKTRMVELANDERAFIRPSPSGGALGGVARKTRESILVCEAAGFDVVLVETVGVGQGETLVAEMVDFFLVLLLAGAGDELQGIKRGLIELADMIAVNKADADNVQRAELARREYEGALSYLRPRDPSWQPPVLTCSAVENRGVDELWQEIVSHRAQLEQSGALERRRAEQQLTWMWSLVQEGLVTALREHPRVTQRLATLEAKVREGHTTAALAAQALLAAFAGDTRG